MRRTILPFLLTVLASPLAAQNAACTARVDGQDVVIAPGAMVDGSGAGLRERLTSWPSRGWDRVWGNPRSCDSGVLIAFLTGIEGMTEDEADAILLLRWKAYPLFVAGAEAGQELAEILMDRP